MKRIPGIHYEFIEEKTDNPIADYVKSSKRVFESGSQRDDDTNKPLVNHLDAYVRLRFGYLLRMGANKYEKSNCQAIFCIRNCNGCFYIVSITKINQFIRD